MLEKVDFAGKY